MRTTTRVGVLLTAGAALRLILAAGLVLPVAPSALVPIDGWIPALVADVLVLAGLVVLAVDGTAASPLGRPALIAWGAGPVVLDVLVRVPMPVASAIALGTAVPPLTSLAALQAAVSVFRARVLPVAVRWTVLAVAIVQASVLTLGSTPVMTVQLVPAVTWLAVATIVALLAAGILLIVEPRRAAISLRLRAILAAW